MKLIHKTKVKDRIIQVLSKDTFWVTLLSTALLLLFYGKIILSPNSYLMSSSGDGIKNYYTYAYHVAHDQSYIFFEGMNYPFKELHLFTDGNPVLANLVKLFSELFPPIKNYSIGIYNSAILWSALVSCFVVLLIFRRLGVRGVVAIIGSLIIVFQDPMWFRLFGHLSLTFHFIIPLSILLTIDLVKKSKRSTLIWIIILNTCSIFTHVYLGIILTFFYFVFFVVHGILKKHLFSKSSIIKIFTSSFGHIIIFILFTILFDTVDDRPAPLGFAESLVGLTELIVPYYGPTKAFLEQVCTIETHEWESLSYIGIPTLFILLLALIRLIEKIRSKKFQYDAIVLSLSMTAIISVLFASGIIYALLGDWVAEVPFLNQVRVIGRFTWLFYFITVIFTFYFINKVFRFYIMKNMKKTSFFFMFIILILYSADIYVVHRYNQNELENSIPNYFVDHQVIDRNGELIKKIVEETEKNENQAILSFPSFFLGGEFFVKGGTQASELMSFSVSMRTGLPLVSSCMSRTSIKNTKLGMSMYAPPYFKQKSQLESKINDKKFLVLNTKQGLEYSEKELLKEIKSIFDEPELELGYINASELYGKTKEKIEMLINQKDSMHLVEGGYWSNREFVPIVDNLIWSNYDSIARSGGALKSGTGQEYMEFFSIPTSKFEIGKTYVFSFWYYNGYDEKKGVIIPQEYLEDGTVISEWDDAKSIVETPIVGEEWSLVELPFKVTSNNGKFTFTVSNVLDNNPIIVDDLLIREDGQEVYRYIGGTSFYYNNYLFR